MPKPAIAFWIHRSIFCHQRCFDVNSSLGPWQRPSVKIKNRLLLQVCFYTSVKRDADPSRTSFLTVLLTGSTHLVMLYFKLLISKQNMESVFPIQEIASASLSSVTSTVFSDWPFNFIGYWRENHSLSDNQRRALEELRVIESVSRNVGELCITYGLPHLLVPWCSSGMSNRLAIYVKVQSFIVAHSIFVQPGKSNQPYIFRQCGGLPSTKEIRLLKNYKMHFDSS